MNKQDCVKAVMAEVEKQGFPSASYAEAERYVDALLNVIQQSVVSGDSVKFVNFGTFSTSSRAERVGRNPTTNEAVTIPATVVPKFKPGTQFKNLVSNSLSKTV